MPIYVYRAKDRSGKCDCCRSGVEVWQRLGSPTLHECPKCGRKVEKVIQNFSIGLSKSGLDRRSKERGFHKIKRLGNVEYEKTY